VLAFEEMIPTAGFIYGRGAGIKRNQDENQGYEAKICRRPSKTTNFSSPSISKGHIGSPSTMFSLDMTHRHNLFDRWDSGSRPFGRHGDLISVIWSSLQFQFRIETFEKCSILTKVKEGENFNHRNILNISRIEI